MFFDPLKIFSSDCRASYRLSIRGLTTCLMIVMSLSFLQSCASNAKDSIPSSKEPIKKSTSSRKPVSQGPSIALAQDDVKVQIVVADQYYKNREFDRAEKAYLNAIRLDNNQTVAHYRLGNIAFRKGQFQQASVFFETALSQSPNNPKIHYNLAASYLSLADKHFSQYLRVTSPKNPQVSRIKKLLDSIQNYGANQNNPRTKERPQVRVVKDPLDDLADALDEPDTDAPPF